MKTRTVAVVAGCLAYMIVVFPVAYVWHLVLFDDIYRRLGYIGRSEPIVAFGFLAIATQGLILSFLYPVVSGRGSLLREGLRLGLIAGVYHWTIHVVSEAARQPLAPLSMVRHRNDLSCNSVLFCRRGDRGRAPAFRFNNDAAENGGFHVPGDPMIFFPIIC